MASAASACDTLVRLHHQQDTLVRCWELKQWRQVAVLNVGDVRVSMCARPVPEIDEF